MLIEIERLQFFQLVLDVVQIRLGLRALELELGQTVLCGFECCVGGLVAAEQSWVIGVCIDPCQLEVPLQKKFGTVLAMQVDQLLSKRLKQLQFDRRVVDEDPTASLR